MDFSLLNITFPKISDKLIKRFFNKEVKAGEIDADLYLETASQFEEAIDESIGLDFEYNHPDNVMRAKLRTNLHAFSGAKSLAMFEQIRAELTNEDGSVRTFAEFKDKVLDIDLQYNTNWLKTEYNQSVVQSQHAKNWNRFKEDADLYPNLKYVTVGDDRVRNDHRALDGIIRPVEDAFWNTYAPQNGWGCRCTLEQMDEEAELTEIETARGLGKGVIKQKMFKTNIGKTGIVFEDSHPYFKNAKGLKKQLKAVENHGMREYVDIYNKPKKLAKYKAGIKTEEDYVAWFDKKVKNSPNSDKTGFVLASKIGHKIEFKSMLKDKPSIVKQKRYLYADELDNVVSNPDEVWTRLDDNPKNNRFITNYIKYYEDVPVILVTTPANKGNAITVMSYYKLDKNPEQGVSRFRQGVLEYRK